MRQTSALLDLPANVLHAVFDAMAPREWATAARACKATHAICQPKCDAFAAALEAELRGVVQAALAFAAEEPGPPRKPACQRVPSRVPGAEWVLQRRRDSRDVTLHLGPREMLPWRRWLVGNLVPCARGPTIYHERSSHSRIWVCYGRGFEVSLPERAPFPHFSETIRCLFELSEDLSWVGTS